jgi:hypothetical protein
LEAFIEQGRAALSPTPAPPARADATPMKPIVMDSAASAVMDNLQQWHEDSANSSVVLGEPYKPATGREAEAPAGGEEPGKLVDDLIAYWQGVKDQARGASFRVHVNAVLNDLRRIRVAVTAPSVPAPAVDRAGVLEEAAKVAETYDTPHATWGDVNNGVAAAIRALAAESGAADGGGAGGWTAPTSILKCPDCGEGELLPYDPRRVFAASDKSPRLRCIRCRAERPINWTPPLPAEQRAAGTSPLMFDPLRAADPLLSDSLPTVKEPAEQRAAAERQKGGEQ